MTKIEQKIPEGWSVKKLKNCVKITGRIGYRGYTCADIVNQGDGAISLSPSNIIDDKIHYKENTYISWEKYEESPEIKIKENDIVFVKTGSSFGKSAIIKNLPEPTTINPQLVIFNQFQGNSLYLSYYISSILFQKYIHQIVVGGTIPTISQEEMYKYNIILPPLPEQEKIAGILSCWDDGIEKLLALIEKKKIQKKALMQQLLTGKHRLKGFSSPWLEVKLGDIADLYQPQTISQSDLELDGYPVYGANGLIGYYHKFNHETWQIMITCRGSTCGTVNRTSGKSWITGNAMVVNVDDYKNDKLFLFFKLLNENFLSIVSGSGQPQIVRTPLAKWKLYIPSDIAEQKAIAEILSKADEEIELLNKKLEAFKQEKKALMQQLLTGKIRVKVN